MLSGDLGDVKTAVKWRLKYPSPERKRSRNALQDKILGATKTREPELNKTLTSSSSVMEHKP